MTTTERLAGRTALVTGGSRGIGRSISGRLARDGALVAVHYGHDHEAAQRAVKEIETAGGRAFAVHAELGVHGDAAALWQEFDARLADRGEEPGLDILVNNAGISVPGTVADVTEENFDRLVAVNARAPFFVVQHALGRLRDGGRIVNVSSAATRTAFPQITAYNMSKGALDTLTPDLAKQLGPRGITVNTVAPGFTDTGINPTLADPQVRQVYAAASVFGRVGTPDDIADAVAFLASDDARWVTGQWLNASGGVVLGP